jgi:RimJ/RimL family protein N-acetyltransferase
MQQKIGKKRMVNPVEQTSKPTMPEIITVSNDVELRFLEREDAPRIKEILESDPSVQERVTWVHGLSSEEEIADKIEQMRDFSTRYGIWQSDRLVGYTGVWEDNGYMDGEPKPGIYGFGYFLDPQNRGTGVMTASVAEMMKATEATYGVEGYHVYVEDDNKESQAVLTALGFNPTDIIVPEPEMKSEERRWEKVVTNE